MAATDAMLACAEVLRPDVVTLVPETADELTTEGGLDLSQVDLRPAVARLRAAQIRVSIFIDPEPSQVAACHGLGVGAVELNTGRYCDARPGKQRGHELTRILLAAQRAKELNLYLAAGHGLDIHNLPPLHEAVPFIEEYNIGHSIVARAVYVGMEMAVAEIKRLIS